MPTYAFRTGKGDEEIDDILSRVPPSARSWFLKETVRLHAGLSDELKKLNQGLERLSGGVVACRSTAEAQPNEGNVDDMLVMGIADILR